MPNAAITTDSIKKRRAERLKLIPERYRRLFIQCWSAKAAPRQAIKAFCLDCMGYVRGEIPVCTAPECPLYEYRPYVPENRRERRKKRTDEARNA